MLWFQYLLVEFGTNGGETIIHFADISFHFARLITSGPVFQCSVYYSSEWVGSEFFFGIGFLFCISYDRCDSYYSSEIE